MATLTIRNLDDAVKAKIREDAARHGVSMEEQVRRILTKATMVRKKPKKDMMTLVRETFAQTEVDYTEVIEFEVPERNEYENGSEVDFSELDVAGEVV